MPEPLQYWHSDPNHPVEDWQYEVANGDTRLGYHEWLARQERERHAADCKCSSCYIPRV